MTSMPTTCPAGAAQNQMLGTCLMLSIIESDRHCCSNKEDEVKVAEASRLAPSTLKSVLDGADTVDDVSGSILPPRSLRQLFVRQTR